MRSKRCPQLRVAEKNALEQYIPALGQEMQALRIYGVHVIRRNQSRLLCLNEPTMVFSVTAYSTTITITGLTNGVQKGTHHRFEQDANMHVCDHKQKCGNNDTQ